MKSWHAVYIMGVIFTYGFLLGWGKEDTLSIKDTMIALGIAAFWPFTLGVIFGTILGGQLP